MVRASVISSVLCVIACGPVIAIGGECVTRDDCVPSYSCVSAPAGFCSKTCAVEGSTKDCPGGTVCTYFGASALICSTFCTDDVQCRTDYGCRALAGTEAGGKKACQPGNVVR